MSDRLALPRRYREQLEALLRRSTCPALRCGPTAAV